PARGPRHRRRRDEHGGLDRWARRPDAGGDHRGGSRPGSCDRLDGGRLPAGRRARPDRGSSGRDPGPVEGVETSTVPGPRSTRLVNYPMADNTPNRSQYVWAQRGDINAFFGLMLDNVGGMILMASLLVLGFHLPREFVLTRMIPGTAVGVLGGD